MADTRDGPLSLAPASFDSACENDTTTNAPNPTWGPFATRLPDALLACLEADIQTRNQQSCRGVRNRGRFACTLGCGALLRSNQDRKRHEEAIYPTEYWICYLCVQPHQPFLMKGQFFHRLDKIRAHCHTRNHSGLQLNLDHCKVFGLSTPRPSHCKLCQHQYTDQHDRETHPVQRHTTPTLAQPSGPNITDGIPTIRRHETEYYVQPGSVTGLLQPPRDDELTIQSPSKPILEFRFLGTKTPLHSDCMPIAQDAIRWLGRVNRKGGTAQVFKVELAYDMTRRCLSQPKLYAVKQFPQRNHHVFRHEVQMYTTASTHSLHGIAECYGSFQYVDSEGLMTHNILLELAEGGDLMDYWLQTRPPTDFGGIKACYTSIFDIATTIRGLHNTVSPIQHTRWDPAFCVPLCHKYRSENILRSDMSTRTTFGFSFTDLNHVDMGHTTRHIDHDARSPSKESVLDSLPNRPPNERLNSKMIDIGCDERLDKSSGGKSKIVTHRYRPPHRLGNPDLIEQRADIWALGMFFSFATTWATLGSAGLRAFEACRRSALTGTTFALDLPFHDGAGLLPAVIAWHQHLKRHKHPHDTITAPLLDLLELRLLEPDPALRADANELCEQLRSLLEIAENNWQSLSLTPSVEDPTYHLDDSYLEGTDDLPGLSPQGFVSEDPQMVLDFFDSGVFVNSSEVHETSSMDPWLCDPSQSICELNNTWAISQEEDEWTLAGT